MQFLAAAGGNEDCLLQDTFTIMACTCPLFFPARGSDIFYCFLDVALFGSSHVFLRVCRVGFAKHLSF